VEIVELVLNFRYRRLLSSVEIRVDHEALLLLLSPLDQCRHNPRHAAAVVQFALRLRLECLDALSYRIIRRTQYPQNVWSQQFVPRPII